MEKMERLTVDYSREKSKSILYILNDILGIIILFFGVFDTTRNYTPLPIWAGYLKDISIYLLALFNISRLKINNKYILVLFIIILFISPIGLFKSGLDLIVFLNYYFKYMEVPLLLLIFMNFNEIFTYNINSYFKKYIILALVLSIINVFGYFVPNPIVSVNIPNNEEFKGLYQGRITVGQPALAIFPVLFAYCFYLINSKKTTIILPAILLSLIFISTSNTGIIAAILCTILILFASNKETKKNVIRYLILLIIIGLVIFSWLVSIIDLSMYTNKILSILNGGKDPSIDIRKVHWNTAFGNCSFIDYIFGNGILGYVRKGEIFNIENTYILIFLCYGIFGVMFLIVAVISSFKKIVLIKKKDNKKYVFLMCVFLIFILHFLTLDIFFCYMLYFSLGLCIAYYNEVKTNI